MGVMIIVLWYNNYKFLIIGGVVMGIVWEYIKESRIIEIFIRLVLAMILGGCIGFEREKYRRPAGFRTHILVCIGACMTALIGEHLVVSLGYSSDASRISAQVISGLGFLGVGTILVKGRDHIIGLTTAAGLWATGVMGIACGFGFYIGAVLCALLIMISTTALFHFESEKIERKKSLEIFIELEDAHFLNAFVKTIEEKYHAHNFLVVAPRSAMKSAVGIEVTFPIEQSEQDIDLLMKITEIEGVVYAIESTPKKLS